MQQVAAQKTDIAALPFSASSTAKAVETGIGTQQQANSQNNQAFNRLYQEAKSSKSDFVLNDKETSGSQFRETTRSTSSSANTSVSNETVKKGKDRDAGHTDLPVDKKVTDNPAESAPSTKEENAAIAQKDIAEAIEAHGNSVGEEKTSLKVDDAEGDIEQKAVTEAEFVIGEGGKKDAEAGVITTPGTPDGKPDKVDEEPDWVAYVEILADRFGKADNREQTQGQSGNRTTNGISEVSDETVNILSVKENGKLWKIPDGVDASDAPSVMAHLLSQLNSDSEEGGIAVESLSTEAQQTLSALTALLLGAESEQNGASGEASAEQSQILASDKLDSNADELSGLIAQLMQQKDSAGNVEQTVNEGAEHTLAGSKNATEESLVLGLLSDELKAMRKLSSDGANSQLEALYSDATNDIADEVAIDGAVLDSGDVNTNGTEKSKVTATDTVPVMNTQNPSFEMTGDSQTDLLTALSELSPQTAQKVTEAFAERVVAVMPNASQQQAVKTNIIAGINEFQQQAEQGREPGIDLSAIVADAAKEAAVNTDVIASMTARVDSQASQFLNLMTQTQSSAQQAFASMVGQTDTVMQENAQLRTEASKSQQQFEGFDKAVNIHKPEGQQQLNEKIRWMVNARNTMAEIRLDPPEMGSMQVRVNVSGDAASVSFVVQSQQAKEALADAMPKLRDMLSEQGIELGDAQVRKDNSSSNENGQQLANNNGRGNGTENRGENDGLDDMGETRIIEQSVTRAAKGGIDFYA
ncbi:flagellar hook-length control protein FliK [Alteromonas sp. BL110]|uniref:flagellar hook-length control protein FliK n=1 Tax=Alteromonas sp. BL110 TaxID=1714845 RepID=UPI000E53CCF3|nr:flagellar hook-length control protein FliK [Alteromonas sp. BL110]AXT37667.1 flagellar hook-length control protein FliK [Alteromonas sp. BL110]RKM80406.1 flagellar hook-length control protein FliK [Alteromonas sp. BL110]